MQGLKIWLVAKLTGWFGLKQGRSRRRRRPTGPEARAPGMPRQTGCTAATVLAVAISLGWMTNLSAVPNPVLAPQHGNAADCGVMKFNGEYYLIGNSLAGDMFVSPDLVHWGNRTHVFSMDNDWTPGDTATDRNINACDPSYYNGVFNLYWSVDRGDRGVVQIGHAIADQPLGPYHEPDRKHWFASKIDAHLFRDDDGSFTFQRQSAGRQAQGSGHPLRQRPAAIGNKRQLAGFAGRTYQRGDGQPFWRTDAVSD
jgi:hypothetical protein